MHKQQQLQRGFTLIEVMVTVAIVAILASVALPSYTAYLQRSKVPPGLDALSSYYTRMEQRYQDTGNYASGSNCAITLPTVANFTFSCVLDTNQKFTATVTGSGPLDGYAYTITHLGVRNTTAHPKGLPTSACWSTRGAQCDS